jgi:mannose-1-phosphate guanylyltransferase
MLLCAGLGTRLGSLSDHRPKPMLPVCGLPIVRYGIAQLVAHGIRDLVINVHHRGDIIERELGDGHGFGARIQYSHEPVLLGTGGGLRHALPLLDPDGTDAPFISMNGKLIFDLDFTALLTAFERDRDALGMMVVRAVADARAWGAVDVRITDSRVRVHDVLGDGDHMFCGVHVTRPSVVAGLPDGEACMIRQGYLPWMRAGAAVAAFEHRDGYFAEHSTPARYLASNWALLDGTVLRHPPAPTTGVDAGAVIADGVELCGPVRIAAGARIGVGAIIGPFAVIGPDAEVAPDARLERTVVWAGCRAEGQLRDAIVTPTGVVLTS